MKKLQNLMVVLVATIAPPRVSAQGTTYLSNLAEPTTGTLAVGSNSIVAAGITTGNNPGGYTLNSVQLDLANATGSQNGFTVSIYSQSTNLGASLPGNSLEALAGPANPATAGLYTYSQLGNLILSPDTDYFLVITSGSSAASGAYEWSSTQTSIYSPGDSWVLSIALNSGNGSSWSFISGTYAQFALNATPLPEPSAWAFLLLGGGVFVYGRRKFRSPIFQMEPTTTTRIRSSETRAKSYSRRSANI